MKYQIEIDTHPKKYLKTLQKQDQLRIYAALEILSENPIPPKAIKLVNRDGYRVRVGDYRIIYVIFNNKLLVQVIDIGHRREIYR